MFVRFIPIIYVILVLVLMHDCFEHRREPFWYLVLLIPVWGVGFYIWRFKWYDSW